MISAGARERDRDCGHDQYECEHATHHGRFAADGLVSYVTHLTLRSRSVSADDDRMADTEAISFIGAIKDPAVRENPYPQYAELREQGRLIPTMFGGYITTHHADSFTVLRDARFSSSNRHQEGYDQFREVVDQIGLGDLFGMFERLMLFADPPDHPGYAAS